VELPVIIQSLYPNATAKDFLCRDDGDGVVYLVPESWNTAKLGPIPSLAMLQAAEASAVAARDLEKTRIAQLKSGLRTLRNKAKSALFTSGPALTTTEVRDGFEALLILLPIVLEDE